MSAHKLYWKVRVEVAKSSHDCHQKGQVFEYPRDMGMICRWTRPCVEKIAEIMVHGGEIPSVAASSHPNEALIRCIDGVPKNLVMFRIIREPVPDGEEHHDE